MDEKKPWEDESLKGPYYEEKKRQAEVRKAFKAKPLPKPKEPSFTGAMAQAYALKKRNEKVDMLTKPLREAATGAKEK